MGCREGRKQVKEGDVTDNWDTNVAINSTSFTFALMMTGAFS